MSSCLVIVDVQQDFVSGSLAVPAADEIFDFINDVAGDYDYVVFTRDWHPADHFSFSDFPEFVDKSWPPHCVQDTPGAELDPRTREAWAHAPVFSKGTLQNLEQYSGFEGHNEDDEALADWLDERNVDVVDVVGLATDYCVRATAIDSANFGYLTGVLLDGVKGVTEETSERAIQDMLTAGVSIVSYV